MIGSLNACRRRRRKPVLRHARASLIADRFVVGREGRLQHEHFCGIMRNQAPLRHGLEHTVRWLPEQFDRGVGERLVLLVVDPLIGLREFKPQGIGPTAEQEDARPVFGLSARLYIGIDERRLVPGRVEGELGRVLGADDEFIHARLGGHDRSHPADRKPIGLEAFRVGTLHAEVEVHLRVDLLVDQFLPIERASLEILGPQSAAVVDSGATLAKARDEIGDGVLILPHGEPGELDAGRPVAVAGHGRIEGAVDVLGHVPGGVAGDLRGVVLRHRLVDVGGELVDGAVADELFRHILGANAIVGVAAGAVLLVDGQAGVVGGGDRGRERQEGGVDTSREAGHCGAGRGASRRDG